MNLVRHEVNSYSQFWYDGESIPSKIKVFFKGDWEIEEILHGNAKVIQVANGITTVEFECQHGLTTEIVLSRIENS